MKHNRRFIALLVVLLFLAGCASTGTSTKPTQSPKAIAYATVNAAFDVYDMGMTTLRTLQRTKIITEAKYQDIKTTVGWPTYNTIKAADDALQVWVTSPTDTNYDKMNAAFKTMAASEKNLTTLIVSLQGGKK